MTCCYSWEILPRPVYTRAGPIYFGRRASSRLYFILFFFYFFLRNFGGKNVRIEEDVIFTNGFEVCWFNYCSTRLDQQRWRRYGTTVAVFSIRPRGTSSWHWLDVTAGRALLATLIFFFSLCVCCWVCYFHESFGLKVSKAVQCRAMKSTTNCRVPIIDSTVIPARIPWSTGTIPSRLNVSKDLKVPLLPLPAFQIAITCRFHFNSILSSIIT